MSCKDYQLRHAAGMYWLLDMRQQGKEYQRPVFLNESGAFLWELLEQGLNRDQIVNRLCQEFDTEPEDVEKDVEDFFQQLEQHGIFV
jgi:hypothetical protein